MKRTQFFLVLCVAAFQWISLPIGFGEASDGGAARGAASHRSVQGPQNHFAGPPVKGNRPFHVKHTFSGKDGARPTASLIQDAAGNLYGTTSSGGNSRLGVVFKLDTANNEIVLHSFSGSDGAIPHGGLVLDGSGNLYGTTSLGGDFGLGTVFKIDPSGTETVVHSFAGNPDGAKPYAGLIADTAGNLYGTTEKGGSSGRGTVFKITATGEESVLHSFAGGVSDGANPKAGVILDGLGNLYGTTFRGGLARQGTVFKLDTNNVETVLYNFTGSRDGGNPFGGVILDSSGILYGTAQNGGSANIKRYGCCKGVLFSVSAAAGPGSEKVLYTFTGGKDGGTPASDLVLYNGTLYGTTLTGGPGHGGTAFSVTIATGSEKVLHGFTGSRDGGTPRGGLLINSAGVIYGTAEKGGRFKRGTLFQYRK